MVGRKRKEMSRHVQLNVHFLWMTIKFTRENMGDKQYSTQPGFVVAVAKRFAHWSIFYFCSISSTSPSKKHMSRLLLSVVCCSYV